MWVAKQIKVSKELEIETTSTEQSLHYIRHIVSKYFSKVLLESAFTYHFNLFSISKLQNIFETAKFIFILYNLPFKTRVLF